MREKVFIEQQKQKYFEAISAKPVYYHYSAQELYKLLIQTRSAAGKKFIVNESNIEQVKQLCYYFSRDENFIGDLDKGLLLMGKLGTGKTHLLAFFQQNQNASFSIIKTRVIENAWINEKETQDPKVIDYYSANRTLAVNENNFGHTLAGYCFDDLGSESLPSKRYGEEKNVISEVILNRYDNKLPFNTTHLTTNLGADEIEKLYGSRVRERLREMCNIIIFDGESWR